MNDLCSPQIQGPVSNENMIGSDTLPPAQPKGLVDPVILEDRVPESDSDPNSEEKPAVDDTTPVDSDTDIRKNSFSAEDSYYKYQSHEHSNSSEVGSNGEPEELSRRSPPGGEYIDERGIDISQRLPSNLGQYSSPFSAEEARLRFSLESSQIRDRYSHLNSSFAEEARRRFSLPADATRSDLPPITPNSASPPLSPDLSRSPYTPYKGQGQGTPRSLDRSFDEQDYALTANVREGLYFCHLCNFSGTTQKDFDQHMTVHFEHVCPHCDYKSRTEGRLKRHIKDFHTEDSDGFGTRTMPGRPKIFRCKQCEYSTTDKIEFWSHSRTHIKEDKLLQCPRCPFVTEYKHHLEYHLRNHFGSKPFKCPKCNYACVNKSMLNSHMKSHTNVYQYRCADCTYATKYCHSLKLHLRKYNHKPAAVLNSDGSLPQGVDATASGLSLLAKRGPPRGPRGPRKDKLDGLPPGFPQMPGLPGPMPGLPGMISPFWPMLHGLPNGLPSPLGLSPRFAPHLPGLPGFGLKTEDLTSPLAGSNTYKCNFCSFVAASRDVLTSHVMKVHAGDNSDLFSIFGISSESILEDKNRLNALNALKSPLKSRLGLYGLGQEFPMQIKRESPEDINRIPRTSSANGQDRRPEKSGYPYLSGKYPGESVQKDEGIDILKQMTLKFGSGPVEPERKPRPESPLDLTKPRNTPPLSGSYHMPADLDRKRDYDDQSSGENSIQSGDVTTPPPRKRSRKGKAFKLDTLCMKLQEQRTQMYGSDEDSNMEDDMYSSDLLPVESDRHTPSAEYDRESARDYSRGKIDVDGNDVDIIDSQEDKNIESNHENRNEESVDKALKEIHSSLAILNNKNVKDAEIKEKPDYDKDPEEKREEPTSSQNDEVVELDLVPKVPSPSHHRRKAVPPAVQRGADIAWKILNNPNLTDPAQILRNGSNGHSLELSPLDKKLWINAPDCIGDMSKGEYECPHCQIAFGDCIMYTMHMGYHGYKDPYKCNMCGDTCKDRVEFFLHIARAAHN